MEPAAPYVSPLERVAPRHMVKRLALHRFAVREIRRASGRARRTSVSVRALDAALGMAETIARRIGRKAAVHARGARRHTMCVADVVAALGDLNIATTWMEPVPAGGGSAAPSLVSANMAGRVVHHEFAYAHRTIEHRMRARIQTSVCTSVRNLVRAFLVVLFRYAASYVAQVQGGTQIRQRDIVRAYREVLVTARAR